MKKSPAIDRLRQILRRQHKALATEDSYVFWVRRYITALTGIPPGVPSEKKLEMFLTGLALRHNVAASTQNQASPAQRSVRAGPRKANSYQLEGNALSTITAMLGSG